MAEYFFLGGRGWRVKWEGRGRLEESPLFAPLAAGEPGRDLPGASFLEEEIEEAASLLSSRFCCELGTTIVWRFWNLLGPTCGRLRMNPPSSTYFLE